MLGRIGKAALHAVEAVFEQPDEGRIRKARATGGLWNTLVCAAKGTALWDLGRQCVSEMMAHFEQLKTVIDTVEEFRVLEAIYDAMPRRNFSSHILQRVPERFALLEMREVLWSDWDNPERILSGLEKFGKRPATAQATPVPVRGVMDCSVRFYNEGGMTR